MPAPPSPAGERGAGLLDAVLVAVDRAIVAGLAMTLLCASKLVGLAICSASCAVWLATGSVYRDPCTHLGVRVHSDDLGRDYAVTVQVSTDWPACAGVYRGRP